MSDLPPPAPAPPLPEVPIIVNSAGREQLAATLRQVVGALSLIAAAFGLAKEQGWLNLIAAQIDNIMTAAFGIVAIVVFVWGNLKTRALSRSLEVLEHFAPDWVAKKK